MGVGDTQGQAMRLKEKLVALLGGDVPYVTPVLAVPLAFVEFGACEKGRGWCIRRIWRTRSQARGSG